MKVKCVFCGREEDSEDIVAIYDIDGVKEVFACTKHHGVEKAHKDWVEANTPTLHAEITLAERNYALATADIQK